MSVTTALTLFKPSLDFMVKECNSVYIGKISMIGTRNVLQTLTASRSHICNVAHCVLQLCKCASTLEQMNHCLIEEEIFFLSLLVNVVFLIVLWSLSHYTQSSKG